jgi:hypothetical protein
MNPYGPSLRRGGPQPLYNYSSVISFLFIFPLLSLAKYRWPRLHRMADWVLTQPHESYAAPCVFFETTTNTSAP